MGWKEVILPHMNKILEFLIVEVIFILEMIYRCRNG